MKKPSHTPADFTPLLAAARQAAQKAYAPYSRFPVGAALETTDGRIITGCNVENSSYGLTLCAERTAIAAAISQGVRSFQRLAIVAPRSITPPLPCGACRQVLAEFVKADFPIALQGKEDPVKIFPFGDLLPHPFELKRIQRDTPPHTT